MNFSRSITFVASFAVLGTAYAGWNRLPYVEARPVDLAASAIPGTKLVSSVGLSNAEFLLGNNVNEAVTLAAGRSSAVIQLNGQQNIQTIVFNNDGAEGRITVGGSVDNRDWNGLGTAVFSSSDRVAQVNFAPATVKYISVSFESVKGGTLRALKVFGASTDRDYSLVQKEAGGNEVNLAAIVGGARPIFAFPTPTSVGELSYLHNVFRFPKSADKFRTIVYDLGAPRTVDRFATSHSLRPVRVEVFAFDKLPEKVDWRGKLTLDPSVFNTVQPVAVGEDSKGVGHVTIIPDKPVIASYIALRFEPNYQESDEFRYAKGDKAGSDDLMVGSVDFHSKGGFEVTKNVGESALVYAPPALPKKSGEIIAEASITKATAAFAPPLTQPQSQPTGASIMPLNSGSNATVRTASNAGTSSNNAAAVVAAVSQKIANANAALAADPYVPGEKPDTTILKTFSSLNTSSSNSDKNKEIEAMYNARVKAAEAAKKAAIADAKDAKDAVYHTPGVTQAQKQAADDQYEAEKQAAESAFKTEKQAAEEEKKAAKADQGDHGNHGDHGDHGPGHTNK